MKTQLLLFGTIVLLSVTAALAQPQQGDTLWTRTYPDNSFGGIVQIPGGGFYAMVGVPLKVYKLTSTGDVVWSKAYATNTSDRGGEIALTPDTGFVVAGENASLSSTPKDIWLLRCNSNGDTIWTRRLDAPGYSGYSSSKQLIRTKDGHYVICGYADVAAGNQDMIFMKFDLQGNIIWSKTYGGSLAEEATDVRQTSDSGYVLSGYTRSYGGVGRAAYVVRTNSNGDTLWTKTYSLNGSAEQWFRSVGIMANGDLIVGGWTGANAITGDVWMLRLTSAGDTIWTRKLTSTANWRQVNRLAITASGNIVFASYSESSLCAGKVDPSGNQLWFRNYVSGTGLAISLAPDGDFYLVGQYSIIISGNCWLGKIYCGDRAYDDPPKLAANLAAGPITIDGIMNEPAWANAKPYLKFGPTPQLTADERSVTGGALVTGTYSDPSFATVKFLNNRAGKLYVGIQSRDKSVGRFGDSWEGDGLFMKIKNAAGADNGEFKLYYTASDRTGASRDSAVYEVGGPFRPGFGRGVGLVMPGTVAYDTTQVDSGYTLELQINLDSLGYASSVDSVQLMMNIFDPDGYHRGTPAWGGPATRAFHKTWWGSEWGPGMRWLMLGRTTDVSTPEGLPTVFALSQNYPNPFNPSTTINFDVPEQAYVKIIVYDVIGREVLTLADGEYGAGYHRVTLTAANLASGVYFYRLEAAGTSGQRFITLKKMLFLK